MSLIKRNGGFPSFPTLFDDLLSRELFNWNNNNFSSTSTTMPSVNIRETDNSFEVEMAAPGMEKKIFTFRSKAIPLLLHLRDKANKRRKQKVIAAKSSAISLFKEALNCLRMW
ncbi:Hsp20/alpha crystallin family protein [Niabella hibiscisoli]|uniref:hypothetical protein n=1 Tax=Niabella hibiscisoli TaxID=1825928 RepID=UPI001F1147BD|nr:hypothetical protein [Niabella hibiscisoli]MCH5718569.1 hypothetical protein [Niabella hibiscisoli]